MKKAIFLLLLMCLSVGLFFLIRTKPKPDPKAELQYQVSYYEAQVNEATTQAIRYDSLLTRSKHELDSITHLITHRPTQLDKLRDSLRASVERQIHQSARRQLDTVRIPKTPSPTVRCSPKRSTRPSHRTSRATKPDQNSAPVTDRKRLSTLRKENTFSRTPRPMART